MDEDSVQLVEGPQEHRCCGSSTVTWKTIIGIIIVIGIALSWVSSTQFAQSTYSASFNAPYFTMWFSTCWMVLVFPLFCIPGILRGGSLSNIYRESGKVVGSNGLTIISLLSVILPFCLLWILTNYCYTRALGVMNAADVTAVFSCCSVFVYVFSWLWLKQRISIIKIMAVLVSIGGVVLLAYADGIGGSSAVGIVLSLAAAVGAALYKVLFKRVVGDATASQVSLFLSCLGVLDATLFWPLIVIFHYTNYEFIKGPNIPWAFLCGTGMLGLVFNFLINFGVAFTYPLFISLGVVLGIPINALADHIFRDKDFGFLKIIAALLIITGFTFMLIPEEYEDRLRDFICCRQEQKDRNNTDEDN